MIPSDREGIVGRSEYLELAQEEANKQRRHIYEAGMKQKQRETMIRLATELSMARVHYFVMSAWYSALKTPNSSNER